VARVDVRRLGWVSTSLKRGLFGKPTTRPNDRSAVIRLVNSGVWPYCHSHD
jgi:hypothetical protein